MENAHSGVSGDWGWREVWESWRRILMMNTHLLNWRYTSYTQILMTPAFSNYT